jgi:hypothetical protein
MRPEAMARRLLWFFAIWAASVIAALAIAEGLRLALLL